MDILETIRYLENSSCYMNESIHQNIIFTFITGLCLHILSYPVHPTTVIQKKMYSYCLHRAISS